MRDTDISPSDQRAQAAHEKVRARDMHDAHVEGLHDDLRREGCPDCEHDRGNMRGRYPNE